MDQLVTAVRDQMRASLQSKFTIRRTKVVWEVFVINITPVVLPVKRYTEETAMDLRNMPSSCVFRITCISR